MRIDRYEYRDRADRLIAFFEAAARRDSQAERKRRLFGRLAIGLGLASCMGLGPANGLIAVGLIALGLRDSLARGIGGFALAPLAIAAVVCAVLWNKHRQHDLDNRKLWAVLRVLKALRADVPRGTPMRLKVDFRDYQRAELRGKTGDAASYHQTWLEAETTLADESRLRLSLTDDVRRKERRKRKYTKVRERLASEALFEVRPAGRYGDAAAIAARLQATPAPQGLSLSSATARGRWLRVVLETPPARRVTGRGGSATMTGALADADTLLRGLRFVWAGFRSSA